MAVTVEQAPSVVLDEGYRVVEVNQAAKPWFADHVGKNVFDCFPGSQALFRPYYERARASGETVEFAQYYGGYVTQVTATPVGRDLHVSWLTVAILDTWTLSGLRASLGDALERLDETQRELEKERARRALRVVGGTG